MNSNEKHIVAIDLGSSKIALTVAKVIGNNIDVIYYKETPSEGVKYSKVTNIMLVNKCLGEAVRQAEEALGIKITQAVVGMPRHPIIQESSTATIPDRGEDTMILKEDIKILKNFAHSLYPLQDTKKDAIYGSVAQSFSDGESFQTIESEIIGMVSNTLEGNFKIFIGKKNELTKIDSVMASNNVACMRKYFTAESTAKAVLTDSEMENGVALIDFGGGCTSVSIYHGNIMRHYSSIPFGGKNLTQDIKMECQISEKLAENIKLAFGVCMPEKLLNLSDKILNIKGNGVEPDKHLTIKYLSEIITARIREIMMAILYEIDQSGFADMLRAGIVITGGGAKITNICNFIYDLSGYKTRVGYPNEFFTYLGCENIIDTTSTTSVGLILSALNDETVNCTAEKTDIRSVEVIIDEKDSEEPSTDTEGQGKIFDDDEIDVVEKPKQRKTDRTDKEEKPNSIRVYFKKVKSKFETVIGDIYENMSEGEEEANTEIDEDGDEY